MQIDAQIFIEGESVFVEMPFCTAIYDLKELSIKGYRHFKYDFEYHLGYNPTWECDILDWHQLDSNERYDVLNDLQYYYGVEPVEIVVMSENKTKTFK